MMTQNTRKVKGEKMNWKKPICVVILTGAALTAMAGCAQTGEIATTTAQAMVAAQSTPAPSKQTPPGGTSFNGTMPLPPSGNITGERPTAPALDLAAAAAKLGITESQLSEALGDLTKGMPDLAAAALKLGLTETALREALGFIGNSRLQGVPPPGSTAPPAQPN
jgi:hypothetical protein